MKIWNIHFAEHSKLGPGHHNQNDLIIAWNGSKRRKTNTFIGFSSNFGTILLPFQALLSSFWL
jgi:hypothetical protein